MPRTAALVLIISSSVLSVAARADAADAFDHCRSANVPATDDVRIVQVTSAHKGGEPSRLQLQTFGRRTAESRRILVRFEAPEGLRDTAFLVVDEKRDPKFYVYTPDLGRTIEVAGPDVGRHLLGTSFAWEDVLLAQGLLGWDEGRPLREETLHGRATRVLEIDRAPEDSSYARVLAWIDLDSCLPLKAELYRPKDRLLRVLTTEPASILRIGSHSIPHETRVRDVFAQTESRLLIQAVIPGLQIPDEILQPDSLGRYHPRVLPEGGSGGPRIDLGEVAAGATPR